VRVGISDPVPRRTVPRGTLSIGVNLAGFIAGAGGSINPVLAALLHNTSSIAVVVNSARPVGHTPHLPSDTTARLRARTAGGASALRPGDPEPQDGLPGGMI
jgi:hypothetical protein